MKKKYILKKNFEFQNIIKNKLKNQNKLFFLYYKNNDIPNNRYGISVGKKLVCAAKRNKIKRKIKYIIYNEIIKQNKLKKQYKDYVIICKKQILNCKFEEIRKYTLKLLNEL